MERKDRKNEIVAAFLSEAKAIMEEAMDENPDVAAASKSPILCDIVGTRLSDTTIIEDEEDGLTVIVAGQLIESVSGTNEIELISAGIKKMVTEHTSPIPKPFKLDRSERRVTLRFNGMFVRAWPAREAVDGQPEKLCNSLNLVFLDTARSEEVERYLELTDALR
jgi:hypothetical protein